MILVDRGFSSPEYGQDRNVSGAVVITSYGGGLGSGSGYGEHRISGKTQHKPGEYAPRGDDLEIRLPRYREKLDHDVENLLHHRPGALITMADGDPLFAVRNESSGKWRWRWRSPWGSVHVSPTLHSSAKNAMIAGRKWLEANT